MNLASVQMILVLIILGMQHVMENRNLFWFSETIGPWLVHVWFVHSCRMHGVHKFDAKSNKNENASRVSWILYLVKGSQVLEWVGILCGGHSPAAPNSSGTYIHSNFSLTLHKLTKVASSNTS
jgi:hypothetical protein